MHLLRGMLGRRGAGILQMNGQPTAQNNRETGADGDLPGFRNWQNEHHVAALAELWNVDPIVIPDWAEPTHAMQIFRYVEQGSLNFLWIAGTSPAVSLPELSRIRKILGKEALFLMVSDGNLTETKMSYCPPHRGARRRVPIPIPTVRSISQSAQSLRQARRGAIWTSGWTTPAGIQWPCNDAAPNGTDRLHVDHHFMTDDDQCETYGHDLATGGDVSPNDHAALRFDGRARLKGAEWTPPPECPDDSYHATDDRPNRLPLPHQNQDGPGT
jgi:ferredoxin-nitrate reductase